MKQDKRKAKPTIVLVTEVNNLEDTDCNPNACSPQGGGSDCMPQQK